MILDVSNKAFKNIFSDKNFHLPIRWDGKDFEKALSDLFNEYCYQVCFHQNKDCQLTAYWQHATGQIERKIACKDNQCVSNAIRKVCNQILKIVNAYLSGFPSKAYNLFKNLMKEVIHNPIKIYPKSGWTNAFEKHDPLSLFRVVKVVENTTQPRSRIFHTPYNLRTKVGTNRYSIAGFPSLYLGTTVELCLEELRCDPYKQYSLCSRFEIIRDLWKNETKIDVIELGIKPQDFFEDRDNDDFALRNRKIDKELLDSPEIREAYLLWFPIIASSSFIRANKQDPFAPEYIIPQLIMQWIRKQNDDSENKLYGIRYFSCSSIKASDMGFNYVFPTSGEKHDKNENFCKTLTNSFRLSKPIYVHEFEEIKDCERYLKSSTDVEMKYVYE